MEILEQMRGSVPEIPRFDDGMVNLQELIRMMAESLVNEIMDAQAEDVCAEGNQRNGYREWTLKTAVGPSACFPKEEKNARYQVLDCVWYGRAGDAAELLEHYQGEGVTKAGDIVAHVAKYLRNNAEFIRANPPSLGTMEAENEHLYASRMKSVPCAWSREGADTMARLRSRKFSGREILFVTREDSLGDEAKKLREARMEEHFNKKYPHPLQYVGHGYEYPHKASTVNFRADVRYHAGLTADHKVREV